jgi:hypothetical protein
VHTVKHSIFNWTFFKTYCSVSAPILFASGRDWRRRTHRWLPQWIHWLRKWQTEIDCLLLPQSFRLSSSTVSLRATTNRDGTRFPPKKRVSYAEPPLVAIILSMLLMLIIHIYNRTQARNRIEPRTRCPDGYLGSDGARTAGTVVDPWTRSLLSDCFVKFVYTV